MHTGDEVLVNGGQTGTLFRLVGASGRIEFWGVTPAYRLFNPDHPAGDLIEREEFEVFYHQRHLENLADQIESGELDYSIPDSSLAALEYCEAAYISSRHRCKVIFPLSDFQIPEPSDWDPGTVYDGIGGGRDGRALAGA